MTAKYNPRQKLSTVLLRTFTGKNCDLYSLHGIIRWLGILTLKNKSWFEIRHLLLNA